MDVSVHWVTSPCRWRRTWGVLGARRPGLVGVSSTNGGYRRSPGIMGDALDMVAVAMVKRNRGRRVVGDVAGMAMARPCLVVSRGFQGMGLV